METEELAEALGMKLLGMIELTPEEMNDELKELGREDLKALLVLAVATMRIASERKVNR